MDRWPAGLNGNLGAATGAGHGDLLHARLAQPIERGLHIEIVRVPSADNDDHLAVRLMVARGAGHRPDVRPTGAGRLQHYAALRLAEERTPERAAHPDPMAEADAAPELGRHDAVGAGADMEDQLIQLAGAVDPQGGAVVAARESGK